MRIARAFSSALDKATNALLIRTRGVSLDGEDELDADDFGDVPFAMAIGLTARPREVDDPEDAPEIVIDDDAPGLDGVAVGGRDASTADVTAALGAGETCLHSTGKGFASRVFCKDKLVAIVVGDGTGFQIDAKKQIIQLFGFGMILEFNKKAKEIRLDSGGTGIQIGNGAVRIYGGDLLFGSGNAPLSVMLGPATGSPGGAASAPMIAAFGIKAGQ